ncbi:MAG: hypothetical protein FJ004_07295 [Chloroflexi bacterium]|nr:hypothetical protein [Chloroflexota bacterium]
MDLEMILKIVLLGLVHWALVPIALGHLFQRQGALGRMKGVWALSILFVTCAGPLFYLILHELMPQPQTQPEARSYWDE